MEAPGAARDKLARWVQEAAGRGAQLLVFPEYGAMELASLGGDAAAADVAQSLAAVSKALPEIDAVHAELARQYRVHIVAASGPSIGRDGRIVNVARLHAPAGVMGAQEKMMMTPFEREWHVSGGTRLRVFETAIGRIGIAICYDSEFPLLVRALAEAQADIILIPSCTEFLSGANRVRTAALARALENTCATVVSPTVGDAVWCLTIDHNTGIGGIYVPAEAGLSNTGVLAEGKLNEPGWVIGDVDLEALHRLRSTGEMRNSTDWAAQPGAVSMAHHAEVVPLE
jgi:predicted amidohydrolase